MNETPAQKPSRRDRLKRLAFRLAAVLIGCLALAAVEGALVVFGVGRDVDLVVAAPGEAAENHRLNEDADRPYYGVIDLGGPEPRRFRLPKPEGTYRVVVLGESTVRGFPYPPELAFPRQLELLLERQAAGRDVEVLNAGVIAINSFAIADLTRQALDAEPDLLVVHAGHNEFYGPGGATSSTLAVPPSVYPLLARLRGLRASQATVGWWLRRQDRGQELMATLPRTHDIPLGGPEYRRVADCFRANLRRMVDAATAAGVPILLTTVASNEVDQSPINAAPPAGPAAGRWKELVARGEASAAEGEWETALAAYDEAERAAEGSAVVSYRRGQAFLELGRHDEARAAFVAARDRDGCRFRAPSEFAAIVEAVARDAGDDAGVRFLDTAARLREVAGPRGMGRDLFLEHVHYNFRGHYELARLIAEFVHAEALGGTWEADAVPTVEQAEALLGAIPQDHLAACSFALQVLDTPPMNAALDQPSHKRFVSGEVARHFEALPSTDRDLFAELSMKELGDDVPAALAARYLASGMSARAEDLLRKSVLRRPWSAEARVSLVQAVLLAGDPDGAVREAAAALDLGADPDAVNAALGQGPP